MILHNCQQGTQEWLELRAGKPTASAFDSIITPGGAPSKSAGAYCNRLIVEVMLGRPLVGVSMPWMERGKYMEQQAVSYYELMKDVTTVPVGFMTTDDGRVGASPDRLVGDRGLLEIKCPTDETHTKYLSSHIDVLLGDGGSVADAYKVQIQGQLYVAERDWSDIEAYYPGLPEAIIRVPRNDGFIVKLKSELTAFLGMFDARMAKLKERGYLDMMAEAAAKKEQQQAKPKPAEDQDFAGLGMNYDDMERYIQDLKNRGKLPQKEANGPKTEAF